MEQAGYWPLRSVSPGNPQFKNMCTRAHAGPQLQATMHTQRGTQAIAADSQLIAWCWQVLCQRIGDLHPEHNAVVTVVSIVPHLVLKGVIKEHALILLPGALLMPAL